MVVGLVSLDELQQEGLGILHREQTENQLQIQEDCELIWIAILEKNDS